MKILFLFEGIFTFLKYTYLLNFNKFKSSEDIRNYQYEELKKTIDYAWKNIPFYKNLWIKYEFEPSMFKTIEDLNKIPCIDKNVVREHYEELIPQCINKNELTLATTGGTTGMPMHFYLNKYTARAKELAFIFWRNWHWGYKMWIDKVAIMRGYRISSDLIKNAIFWSKSKRERGLIFSSFHITAENYNIYIKKLRSYKPKFIKAYPSSIVALCRLMEERKDFKIDGLKGIICSSENVYDWQRALIRKTLGVEILSTYGHSEKIISAYQGADRQMYFNPLYGYAEFLDNEDNLITKEGEVAQLVATSFNNPYFPFIRYKVYDYVKTGSNQNSNYTHVAKRIIGREQEFVYDKNNNRTIFTCSDELFWDVKGIKAYQYVQNVVGKLTINLQCDKELSDEDVTLIRTRAKEMFVEFTIEISLVEEIERTKAGKFKYLIQNIHNKS